MTEQFFPVAEYNYCAIERVRTRDDMRILRRLYHDLETPIEVGTDGPFAFARITGLTASELGSFDGKTITELLKHDGLTLTELRILKEYGKFMMNSGFPEDTQRSGTFIYFGAISKALTEYEEKISSRPFKELKEILEPLKSLPFVIGTFEKLFTDAIEICK
ncbi:MAG: hypothetical protein NUW37_12995 [Planctomycetes bacterium]|nr:hypothetical protein [Planctomycetota bacterium]